jgi:Ser/Thr protein kinase RdoA (MazF antagonist)
MGGQIFGPDLFSRSKPGFERVSDEICSDISNVIKTHYTCLGREVESVEKLSGLEINSKNFKVAIGPRTYALKRIDRIVNIATCNEQLTISQNLLERGILFPRIVRNDEGTLVSSHDDGAIWILAEFIKGDFFSGCSKDFFTVARAVGAMQNTLETIEPNILPRSISVGTWTQTSNILSELLERKREWSTLFPQLEYEALTREHEYFAHSFRYVYDHLSDVPRTLVPTHIDIHPHNILVSADRVPVFVDVDSLQIADRIQCMAFATYKLARQHVVYEGLAGSPKEIAKTTREFVDNLAHAAKVEKSGIAHFPVAATAEVLRRIAIIADLNMHKENREWNAVLHMHFSALHEIPQLFADFPQET